MESPPIAEKPLSPYRASPTGRSVNRSIQLIKTMKTKLASVLIFLGLICASPFVSGSNEGSADNNAYQLPDLQVRGIKELPVPTKKVKPQVGKQLIGTNIELDFKVNKQGRATAVYSTVPLFAISSNQTRNFTVLMMETLKHWKFAPAIDANNQPLPVRVRMKVNVVDGSEEATAITSLHLNDGTRNIHF